LLGSDEHPERLFGFFGLPLGGILIEKRALLYRVQRARLLEASRGTASRSRRRIGIGSTGDAG
jgi:hypothetical protein